MNTPLHDLLKTSFRIHTGTSIESPRRIEAADLLEKEKATRFLQQAGIDLRSPSKIVTASIFFKRYLALLSGALYGMSHHSYAVNLSLSHLVLTGTPDWKTPSFWLGQWKEQGNRQPGGTSGDRKRSNTFSRRILLRSLPHLPGQAGLLPASCGPIQPISFIITTNLWMEEAEAAEERERIRQDYRFLTESADLFGLQQRNPLHAFFATVPHPARPDHLIRLRKQCCLAYRLADGNCCYTCPKLNEECRMKQLLAMNEK